MIEEHGYQLGQCRKYAPRRDEWPTTQDSSGCWEGKDKEQTVQEHAEAERLAYALRALYPDLYPPDKEKQNDQVR